MSLEIRELIRPNLILNFPQETLSQGRTLGAWVAEQLALSSRDGLLSGLSGFLPSGRVLGSKVLPMAQEDLLRGHLVTWTYTSPWDQTRREQWKSFTLTWARLLTFSIVPLYANWSCIFKLEMHFGQVYYEVHGKLTGLPVLKGCDCGLNQWLGVPQGSALQKRTWGQIECQAISVLLWKWKWAAYWLYSLMGVHPAGPAKQCFLSVQYSCVWLWIVQYKKRGHTRASP